MNLHQLYLTNNACYKAGKKITPGGIMVHSTGANNPWLKRYVGPDDGKLGVNSYGNHWNTAYPGGTSVCVHGFIGKLADGTITGRFTFPLSTATCMRLTHTPPDGKCTRPDTRAVNNEGRNVRKLSFF